MEIDPAIAPVIKKVLDSEKAMERAIPNPAVRMKVALARVYSEGMKPQDIQAELVSLGKVIDTTEFEELKNKLGA